MPYSYLELLDHEVMISEGEDSGDEDYRCASSPSSSEGGGPCEGADGGSGSSSRSRSGGGSGSGSDSLAGGAVGRGRAVPLRGRAPAIRPRRSSQPSTKLLSADRRAAKRLVNHAEKFMAREGVQDALFHMALVFISASGAECTRVVSGTPVLAAHFEQPSVQVALEGVVTARSSGRRRVRCSEDSAAAADLNHAQKQAYCAELISKARKAKAIVAFFQRHPLHQPAQHEGRGQLDQRAV